MRQSRNDEGLRGRVFSHGAHEAQKNRAAKFIPYNTRKAARFSRAAVEARAFRCCGLELLDGPLLRALRRRLLRLRRTLGGGAADLVDLDCELDRIGGSLGAQVVHARLEADLPAVEVHGRELGRCRVRHVDVQGLRLVDVHTTIGRHVQDRALHDLPDCLVQVLQLHGQVQVLYAAVLRDELHAQVLRPQSSLDEVFEQVPVDLHELAREHTTHVQVLRVGLEGLVVAQDLRSTRRRHGREHQGVAQTELRDLHLQCGPVPAAALRSDAPEVELQLSFARRRALEGLVCSIFLGELARGLASREIDGLEDIDVQLLGGLALERQSHDHVSIC
mmetsp:Transcript_10136/g.26796  ORF Transcript_10136/g.26796 Transcript_10136/m.26796 type:complete len:333 (+) Transcript_10136:419-1417(+)